MANRLRLDGFALLQADLEALPAEAQKSAYALLEDHARRAAAAVVARYPLGPTGNLKKGVTIQARTRFGMRYWRVRSGAPHAHLYEFGTVKQIPRPVFWATTEPEQRAGVIAVADMVRAYGLIVKGDRD